MEICSVSIYVEVDLSEVESTLHLNSSQYYTIEYIQYSTVQNRTVHYIVVLYNKGHTVQYSTIKLNISCHTIHRSV